MPKTKRQSKTAKKCWSESFGVYGATIRIAEREPGGVLYLLWLDKMGKQQKRSLGHRDRREGKREALAAASAMMQANAAVKELTGAQVVVSAVSPDGVVAVVYFDRRYSGPKLIDPAKPLFSQAEPDPRQLLGTWEG